MQSGRWCAVEERQRATLLACSRAASPVARISEVDRRFAVSMFTKIIAVAPDVIRSSTT
jgi:hypothetical protein